jgi:hypothetical protein
MELGDRRCEGRHLMARVGRAAYVRAMRRQPFIQSHTVVYQNHGEELARYIAASEREAEACTTRQFFDEHPEFDEFEVHPGLAFRIEGGNA